VRDGVVADDIQHRQCDQEGQRDKGMHLTDMVYAVAAALSGNVERDQRDNE
jgi:hypothetical protein